MWNEPDASSNSCINSTTWLEHYTLRSAAAQHAFADVNADVATGALAPCPFASCPAALVVAASAFAQSGFFTNASALGQATVQNEHLLFPPSAGVSNASWSNLQARMNES